MRPSHRIRPHRGGNLLQIRHDGDVAANDVDTTDRLLAVGTDAGLAAVGVAPVEVFERTRADLVERRARGLHAGMQFTYRNPERSTDPARSLPGARSLVVGAWSYRSKVPPPPEEPLGRVAAYAWRDHYADLRRALQQMADVLSGRGHRTRVLADDNALVDREAARRAGLGWYGKNANLLLPGKGSWFVLGSVLTDAELRPSVPVEEGCGSCARCLDGCPTGAIIAPGVVDARRCLAWLVQAEGPFPLEHREALGDRLYGCDDCQEVCPPNRAADRSAPDPGAAVEAWVPLLDLLDASDATLVERHGRWYIPRRDPRYLRRNALIALANTASPDDPAVLATVDRYVAGEDELLAEHATWARSRLASRRGGETPCAISS